MSTVVRMMRMDGSGLDIRDRQWLKITIPNAFIGSELVDWLHNKVEGLQVFIINFKNINLIKKNRTGETRESMPHNC